MTWRSSTNTQVTRSISERCLWKSGNRLQHDLAERPKHLAATQARRVRLSQSCLTVSPLHKEVSIEIRNPVGPDGHVARHGQHGSGAEALQLLAPIAQEQSSSLVNCRPRCDSELGLLVDPAPKSFWCRSGQSLQCDNRRMSTILPASIIGNATLC